MQHCPNPECASIADYGVVAEFRDGVSSCTHCDSGLVQGPPEPEPQQGWQELVPVASFLEVHSAYAAQSALRAAGIEATLPDEHYAAMRWDHALALGGIRVCVPADQAEAARELVAGIDPAEVEAAAGASDPAEVRCPACGSTDLKRIMRGRIPTLIGYLLLGLPTLLVRRRTCCRSCGNEYTP